MPSDRVTAVRRHRQRCGEATERGFTLVEMMIVVAIVGLMLGTAIMTVRNVARSELRSAASRTAATLRYAFDRATMTGNTVRVAFDFASGQMWLEMAEGRVALRRGGDQHHTTDEKEVEADDDDKPKAPGAGLLFGLGGGGGEEAKGEEGGEEGGGFGVDAAELKRKWERDLAPVSRPKSLFKPIDKSKKVTFAARVSVDQVATPRMIDPATKGTAYIYFFPQGHAEPAIVHLIDKSDEVYSVVLHPLTGQARVYACLYGISDDFGVSDDQKKRGRSRSGAGECGEDDR